MRAAVVVADGLGVLAGVDFEDAEDFADVVGVAVDFADVAVDFADVLAAAVVFVGVAVFEDALVVAVGVAVFDGGSDVLAGDGELLADFRVSVVVLVGDFVAVLLADELDVGVDVGVLVAEALVVGSLVDGVGLGEGLVLLGDGVGVGVGLGDVVAACTGSHCWAVLPLAVATARISPAG